MLGERGIIKANIRLIGGEELKNMVYVIVDKRGNYISPKQIDDDCFYVAYTGIATGFAFYASERIAQKKLDYLKLGNKFKVKCMEYKSIPMGARLPVDYESRQFAEIS